MEDLITKETKEIFEGICGLCGKRVQGSTKDEVIYNLGAHRGSKGCKSKKFVKDVGEGLPKKTKDYDKNRKCHKCGKNPKILNFQNGKLICDECSQKKREVKE